MLKKTCKEVVIEAIFCNYFVVIFRSLGIGVFIEIDEQTDQSDGLPAQLPLVPLVRGRQVGLQEVGVRLGAAVAPADRLHL